MGLPARDGLLFAAAFFLTSCYGDDASGPADLVGEYRLTEVDGHAVPAVVREFAEDPACLHAGEVGSSEYRVNFGSLELQEEEAFRLSITIVRLCTFSNTQTQAISALEVNGVFESRGDQLELHPANGGPALMGGSTGERIEIFLQNAPLDGSLAVFRRAP